MCVRVCWRPPTRPTALSDAGWYRGAGEAAGGGGGAAPLVRPLPSPLSDQRCRPEEICLSPGGPGAGGGREAKVNNLLFSTMKPPADAERGDALGIHITCCTSNPVPDERLSCPTGRRTGCRRGAGGPPAGPKVQRHGPGPTCSMRTPVLCCTARRDDRQEDGNVRF